SPLSESSSTTRILGDIRDLLEPLRDPNREGRAASGLALDAQLAAQQLDQATDDAGGGAVDDEVRERNDEHPAKEDERLTLLGHRRGRARYAGSGPAPAGMAAQMGPSLPGWQLTQTRLSATSLRR